MKTATMPPQIFARWKSAARLEGKIFNSKIGSWDPGSLILYSLKILFDNHQLCLIRTPQVHSRVKKSKPNRIYEAIVSYIVIFSHSAKPNILSLWTLFNFDVTFSTLKIPGDRRRHNGFWSTHDAGYSRIFKGYNRRLCSVSYRSHKYMNIILVDVFFQYLLFFYSPLLRSKLVLFSSGSGSDMQNIWFGSNSGLLVVPSVGIWFGFW